MFAVKKHAYHRADATVWGAHGAEGATSLTMSPDKRLLASRGSDATVAIWDTRKFKEPLLRFTNAPCMNETSKCAFRPDGQLLVQCVCVCARSWLAWLLTKGQSTVCAVAAAVPHQHQAW